MTIDGSERLRTSVNLKVIPRRSEYAVYHGVYGGLFLAGKDTVDLLQYFNVPKSLFEMIREGRLTGEQAISLVPLLISKGLLVPATFDEKSIIAARRQQRQQDLATGRQVRAVQLVLANRCNLRCNYCFEALGETPLAQSLYANASPERVDAQVSPANMMMTSEKGETYLRAVIELVRRAGNKVLAVQFFGGEPLVNWNVARYILNRFGDGDSNVALSYSVVTNGTIVTKEMAETFRNRQVSVIVSYDSPRGDARLMRSGKNSHDAIRRGIDLLHQYGIRLALNAALTDATFDLFDRDLVDFAFSHGVYEIGVVLDLDPSFYRKHGEAAIVDKLWDVYVYGKSKGVIVTGYWHQIFQGVAADDRYEQIGFQNCSAMGVQFSIEPSGVVFACKASGGYFGNAMQMEDLLRSETYRKYAMRACVSPEPCRDCEIQHFCGGLCLGSIENKYGGDIWSVENYACNVYRSLTRRLISSTDE